MTGLADHFRRMATYNERANRILYDVCAELTIVERIKPRSSFFGSIHATLNHILVGDELWMTRLEGGQAPSIPLDTVLHEEFSDLRKARVIMDTRITDFMAELTDRQLTGTLDYINNAGERHFDPIAVAFTQLFNHQTHHRGQVHGMLSQTNVAPPPLDLHVVIRN